MSITKLNSLGISLICLISIIIIGNSRLLGLEELFVEGNYEFTKISIFLILFPVILGFFLIIFHKYFNIHKNFSLGIGIGLFIFIISAYFSEIPLNSVFGGNDKAHGVLTWINIFFFIYFIYGFKNSIDFKKIFLCLSIIGIGSSLYGIKELFFPGIDYGDLGSRFIGTFGHPNYAAAFFLLMIPFVYQSIIKNKKDFFKKYFFLFCFLLFSVTIFFTQSSIAIFLLGIYLLFECNYLSKRVKIISLLLSLVGGFILMGYFIPEKFSSFVSRYYIWETIIHIIQHNTHLFLTGIGAENISYYFDLYKAQELYLYENIGYTADRSHNFYLDIFVQFGLFGIIFFGYGIYIILKNLEKYSWQYTSFIFFLVFYIFHFPSILTILLLVLIITSGLKNHNYQKTNHYYIFSVFFIIIGVVSSFSFLNFYKSETLTYHGKYIEASKQFPFFPEYFYNSLQLDIGLKKENNFGSEKYFLYKLYFSVNKIQSCKNLVEKYPSVENYLYCGNLLEKKFGYSEAEKYYKKSIELFPDIWDNNSYYLNSFPGKYIIQPERILHPKFSNIQEVYNKINK